MGWKVCLLDPSSLISFRPQELASLARWASSLARWAADDAVSGIFRWTPSRFQPGAMTELSGTPPAEDAGQLVGDDDREVEKQQKRL
jgi:hypothetical protein